MPRVAKAQTPSKDSSTANLGFEEDFGPEHTETSWRHLIEADMMDTALPDSATSQCKTTPQVLIEAENNMVAQPGKCFYSTQIPVCLWFLAKNKAADAQRSFRDRRKQTSFLRPQRRPCKPTCAVQILNN